MQKDGGNASSKITPCHVPRPGTYGLLLALSIIAILCMPALSPPTSRGAVVGPARADPLAGTLLIHVVRTGPAEASVLGVAVTVSDLVEVLVDSTVVRTTVPVWNLDYW
ncbi:MAG TPA: hypothetical protein VK723_07330, partial [Thermoplasmata archaeon]|nr:hypothetical protein [Thermoplasmata archaeon]